MNPIYSRHHNQPTINEEEPDQPNKKVALNLNHKKETSWGSLTERKAKLELLESQLNKKSKVSKGKF